MTPQQSDGAAFTSHFVTSHDGLRLHVRLYGRPGASLPVVCLPGLTRNSSEFHGLASGLLSRGGAEFVVAVDYRGRGLSDHDPEPANYAIPVETGDLITLLADLGLKEIVVVGTSRGGLIGMVLAAANPGLVKGLVLNDVGPVIERAGLIRIKSYVGEGEMPADLGGAVEALKHRFGDQFPNLTDPDWTAWAETVWTFNNGVVRLQYDPALSRTLDGIGPDTPLPDLWQVFDTLEGLPMMVVRGRLSDLLSAATVAEMVRRHHGLVAVEVHDEGHTPILNRPSLIAAIANLIVEAGPSGVQPL